MQAAGGGGLQGPACEMVSSYPQSDETHLLVGGRIMLITFRGRIPCACVGEWKKVAVVHCFPEVRRKVPEAWT